MGLVFDEIHIKDLVYDKHQGTLIRFTNLGDINNCLLKFEAFIQGEEESQQQLAKSMFVVMIRGYFGKFNFPYVQLACCSISGDLLMAPVWEAVSRLERQGIKVLSLTCDGASFNRGLWQLHQGDKKKPKKPITRDTVNNKEDEDNSVEDNIKSFCIKFQICLLQMVCNIFILFLTHHIC